MKIAVGVLTLTPMVPSGVTLIKNLALFAFLGLMLLLFGVNVFSSRITSLFHFLYNGLEAGCERMELFPKGRKCVQIVRKI